MKFRSRSFLLLSTAIAACGPTAYTSSAVLQTAADSTNSNDVAIHYSGTDSESFCKSRPADECFTLILTLPSPELESSLSLGALAISLSAEKFRVPFLRACGRAIDAYAKGYQGRSTTLRAKFFSSIKETRCLIDIIRRETYEPPQLPYSAQLN